MDKSLFKRAVEDTPEATPGYMFRDIANWTFVDQNTQAKLVAALFDKLTPKTSVHVLAKVLRIIKIVCETGHSDFQKEMQRRSDQIKDYASFRGVPHPQFGDRLNEKVRIAAKEAIDAAFTARKDNKIQVEAGHGSGEPAAKSSSYVSAATGAVSGVLGAVGFSSFTTGHQISASQAADARMAAMPTTNKWAEHMARAGAGEPSAPRQLVTNVVDKAKLGFGLFGNEQIKSNEERYWSGQADVGEFKAVDIAFVGGSRGPFGPNATPSASAATNASSSAAGATNWKFADEAEAGLPPIEHHATLTRFLTPYQREVERIAAMKHAPQRVDITQFLAAVKEIHESGDSSSGASSYEDLAQTLDEGIAQKHPWQARLNVMTLIEALVRAELSPEIGAYFNENPEDVQRNVHVVQSSLKEKSQKVLRLLGIPERSSAAATAAPTASSASAAPQAGADLTFEGMTTSSRRARRGVGAAAGSEEPAATAPTMGFAPSQQQQQQPPAVTKSPSPPSVSAADPLDVLMGAPPRQSAVAAAAADPTKLRKRAQINADDFLSNSAPTASSSAPAAASAGWGSADANAGWGSSAGTGASSGGWGGDAASSGGWGASSGGSGGGWGETPSAAPAPAPAAAPAPAPVAAVAAKSKAAMDFDELFSSAPVAAPQQQPQTFAPIAAPSPSGPTAAQQAADQQMAMVVQMQQQVQGMLAQINMNDPSALPQMQMLMQQQQQLMTMMQQAQAAQTAANAQAAQQQQQQQSGVVSPSDSLSFSGPLQPHGQFNAPPLVKDHTKEKAFADVQNEMVKMLMTQK